MALFDVQGRQVRDLLGDEVQSAGEHQLRLDARRLARGVYFVRLRAGGCVATTRLIVE